MSAIRTANFNNSRHYQHGAALMVMLVIMVIGAAVFLVSALNSSALQTKRDKITADALAQAKEALIGYAAAVPIDFADCLAAGNNCKRPGDLPCPDTNNDGVAEPLCGNATGNNPAQRLGRLPWKTLGLPDLRDGSGERLWYAVSNNFKKNTRTVIPLNSDTLGTISIFSPTGNILYDSTSGTGVVAVIIAPGDVLTRTDKPTAQDRSITGINNPQNYLDITLGQDNANIVESSATNGFIQGRVKDNNGNVILNDQLLAITQDNIMQPLQKRVAAEVKQCLNAYASDPNNKGHYPWAAPLDATQAPKYIDTSNSLFGRIPDVLFNNTRSDGDNLMLNTWPGGCNINSSSGWWLNWKEIVFYGLAPAYEPADPLNTPAVNACATVGACISINPPSVAADKQFVVIVAGKMLSGQVRSSNANKGTLSNYLEGTNTNGASPFAQGASSATFNDTVVFQ